MRINKQKEIENNFDNFILISFLFRNNCYEKVVKYKLESIINLFTIEFNI